MPKKACGGCRASDILLLNAQEGYKINLLIPAAIAESLTLGESIEAQIAGPDSRSISGK